MSDVSPKRTNEEGVNTTTTCPYHDHYSLLPKESESREDPACPYKTEASRSGRETNYEADAKSHGVLDEAEGPLRRHSTPAGGTQLTHCINLSHSGASLVERLLVEKKTGYCFTDNSQAVGLETARVLGPLALRGSSSQERSVVCCAIVPF